jgi:hypothetical protein
MMGNIDEADPAALFIEPDIDFFEQFEVLPNRGPSLKAAELLRRRG